MKLVESVYRLTKRFPADEKAGLSATLRRTAAAVPAKLAEGHAQNDEQAMARSAQAAAGMLREMQTYFLLSRRLGYLHWFGHIKIDNRLKQLIRRLELIAAAQKKVGPKVRPPAFAVRQTSLSVSKTPRFRLFS